VFGCNAAEVLGQPLDTLLSEPLRQVVHDYQRRSEARLWVPEGLQALRGGGQPFPVEATLSRTFVTGKPLYTMILRDIEARSRRKRSSTACMA
jgi:PAS domain S-box-containing protein